MANGTKGPTNYEYKITTFSGKKYTALYDQTQSMSFREYLQFTEGNVFVDTLEGTLVRADRIEEIEDKQ